MIAAIRLDDQIGFLLRLAYQRASSNLSAALSQHDVTPMQFATLARLGEHGKVSQNRLGRLVAMEPANIRDTVLRLKRRGLVATESDPDDARLILVSLTPSGRDLIDILLPLQAAATEKTLAPVSTEEARLLFGLLHRLAEAG